MKSIRITLAALAAALLVACGGGDSSDTKTASASPSIMGAAHAQTPPGIDDGKTLHQLHFIIRPDASGNWFVQNDVDHASFGVSGVVTQTAEYLEVHFTRSYSHAGTVQVTPDDDMNGFITAGSNLGLSSMRIRIKANGTQINPANIWSYGPTHYNGGNLWVNVTMVQK